MKTDERFMAWSYHDLPLDEKRREAARSFLSMKPYWDKRVMIAEQRLEEFEASKYSPRSSWPSGVPGGNRGYHESGLDRKLAAGDHLSRNVARARKERDDVVRTIEEALSAVKTPKAADAVRLIHLEGMTAPMAGKILGLTDRHVRRLKSIGYLEMRLPDDWEERLAA